MRRAPGQFNNWVIGLLVQIIGFPLKITGTMTADRTQTARDASGNLCLDSVDNAFSVTQRFNAAEAIACGIAPTAGNGILQVHGEAFFSGLNSNKNVIRLKHSNGAEANTGILFSNTFFSGSIDAGAAAIYARDTGSQGGDLTFYTSANGGGTSNVPGLKATLDQAGNFGIGVTPTAGNGSLQLGTGSANGIGFQSGGVVDTSIYRGGVGVTVFDGAGGAVDPTVSIRRTSGASLDLFTTTGNGFVSVATNHPLILRTNNTDRMTLKATGQLRFIPLSADPAGAETGDVYYNSTTNKLRVYNGAWVDLH